MSQELDIETALLQLSIDYQEKSHYFKIRCPYHNDRTPDMKVYKNTYLCICYACGKRIHLSSFIKEQNGNVYTNLNVGKLKFTKKKYTKERIVVKYPQGYTPLEADIGDMGFTTEMRKEFNIGYCRYGMRGFISTSCPGCYYYDKDNKDNRWIRDNKCFFALNRIMIPTEMGGILYDIESRDISGLAKKKVLFPHRSKNGYTIFNHDNLDPTKPLYTMEGRKSCLRFWKDIDKNCTAIFSNRLKSGQIDLFKPFKHIILIPDRGPAGDLMVDDFLKQEVEILEIVLLPKVLICKGCKMKFRGEEKIDICPNCKSEKVSFMDVFDFELGTLQKALTDNRLSKRQYLFEKLGVKEIPSIKITR